MKTTLFVILALVTSGSAMLTDQEVKSGDDLQNRKLSLLEKLETGKRIAPDEIRSSFEERHDNEFCLSLDCPVLIPHDDMEKLNESVRHDLETIRHELGSLKNSDEFRRAMDEIRKGSDEIRRELEKMREEIRKSDRRSGDWENE